MAGLIPAAFWWAPATAEYPCDNGLVTVRSDTAELAGQVCRAADRAFGEFAACGETLSRPVTVRTEEDILGGCLGLFHCGQAVIEVLTPRAIRDAVGSEGLYAHIPTDEMFESIVIHELTHALYDERPCASDPTACFVTSEYLAYALQFDALSGESRRPWLALFDADAPVATETFSLGMLMLSNDDFALSAWAHLNQRADRCAWISGLLGGEVVYRRPRP